MAEEMEREREHTRTHSRPSRIPRTVGVHACPPHACDPTAGVRDGMETSHMVNNSNPPTAELVGLASWTARRQFADGRQNSRLSTPGLAGDERDGEEQDGPGPPYQPKPTAESHLVLPVVTEQAESHLVLPVVTELATTHPVLPVASEPQCAPGMAGATVESLPCPGDDRQDLQGLACSVDGEVAATLGIALLACPSGIHPRPRLGLRQAMTRASRPA